MWAIKINIRTLIEIPLEPVELVGAFEIRAITYAIFISLSFTQFISIFRKMKEKNSINQFMTEYAIEEEKGGRERKQNK